MSERDATSTYFLALFDDWAGRISTALTLLALVFSLLPTASMPLLFRAAPREFWFVACFALFGFVNYRIYSRLAQRNKELKETQIQMEQDSQEQRRLAEAQEARNVILDRERRERRLADFRRTSIFFRFNGATWGSEPGINLVNEGAPARDLDVLSGPEGIRLGSRHVKAEGSVGVNFRCHRDEKGPIEIVLKYKDEVNRERKHSLRAYPGTGRLEQDDVSELPE